jgi:hypothetical protein
MLADKLHKQQYYISNEVPSLMDIAVEVVSSNFTIYPHLSSIKQPTIIDRVIDRVSTDLPITITAPFIQHESYWKKACERKWKNLRPDYHGWSWKQAYIETYIQELLMKNTGDASKFIPEIMACRNFIFGLKIDYLPTHTDLKVLFHHVPNLSDVSLTYGAKHLGDKYERSMFGMRMEDAASLVDCMKMAPCLISLSLPCNLIDDELMKMLISGLLSNKTMTDLDLSHNRIGDKGALKLAKYIFRSEIVISLNLADNQIAYDGARSISQALLSNRSLQYLSLKHNRIDDLAGAKMFNDLSQNETLL